MLMVYRLRNVRVLVSQKRSRKLQVPEILSDCWDELVPDSYCRKTTVTVTELTEPNPVMRRTEIFFFVKKYFFIITLVS